ncbi:MAG: class I SAM-dependent methyltransferase [Anaerolineales bacterium]|nr:class I SAM-dependent methyltransferase [Anaerolineales bacterium]
MTDLILKPGRERSVLNRHPWIFSGAVAKLEGDVLSGGTTEVLSSEGEWLARGAYSPHSKIRLRIWTWEQNQLIDEQFFRSRILRAASLRSDWLQKDGVKSYRLFYAESDGLPGLIVDRYQDFLVLQFLSAGPEYWRETILDMLFEIPDVSGIYERSDVEVRKLEGLELRTGLCRGKEPGQDLLLEEGFLKIRVDIKNGHKTGFYLDQREHRRLIHDLPGKGRMLNCFCYTGAFTTAALLGGASEVVSIDSSEDAITLAREHIKLNNLNQDKAHFIVGDVFKELRTLRDKGESFDTIVLDPPKFAPTVSQAKGAARGYKDINLLAFKLLKPGGRLITFSCSGGIHRDLFQKIVADAARDAGVDAVIEKTLSQPADHPISLQFPESRYLKGLVCRVVPG